MTGGWGSARAAPLPGAPPATRVSDCVTDRVPARLVARPTASLPRTRGRHGAPGPPARSPPPGPGGSPPWPPAASPPPAAAGSWASGSRLTPGGSRCPALPLQGAPAGAVGRPPLPLPAPTAAARSARLGPLPPSLEDPPAPPLSPSPVSPKNGCKRGRWIALTGTPTAHRAARGRPSAAEGSGLAGAGGWAPAGEIAAVSRGVPCRSSSVPRGEASGGVAVIGSSPAPRGRM